MQFWAVYLGRRAAGRCSAIFKAAKYLGVAAGNRASPQCAFVELFSFLKKKKMVTDE